MKLKAVQERSYPYQQDQCQWKVVILCGEHNHPPFTGDPSSSVPAPAQFRKIEQDGIKWLTVMSQEAKCDLRQLTIGLRISFGDKYQYVKGNDVRNALQRVKQQEEKKMREEAWAQHLRDQAREAQEQQREGNTGEGGGDRENGADGQLQQEARQAGHTRGRLAPQSGEESGGEQGGGYG
ncbi:hypothetical protein QBC46DRAFT_377651 [Diplogelasinospora grovesii]|uniref:Uncharacterized protein n=1 Tax=Diplogelasinospora grovesii TaxID=303347 RepID=A0AAN6NE24_9PEZI|nr:hypothetical protein QBC46DRAFT_377651 [Diplogelasinospora grovesii]